MKKCLIYLLCLLSVQVFGQNYYPRDTFKIKEVIINRKQISSVQPGFKVYNIDSVQLRNYSLSSLSDALNETTPLFLKCYGSGGLATSSFRGTSAGHTQIAWNGIDINDPMLGQSDFSLIPVGLIENVVVSFGGASMDLGDGAIGGIINLENNPLWKKQTTFEATTGTGSFGKYSGLIKLRSGNDHFQSVTKVYLSSSKNNFSYLDTADVSGPIWKKREHSDILQKGIMQELYLMKSENILSARIWYQTTSRNMPGSLLWGCTGEKQNDESFRTLIDYEIAKGKIKYFTTGAFMLTNNNYSSTYMPESMNKVMSYILKGGMTIPLGDYSRLKVVMSDELNEIKTNNYTDTIWRNNASVTLSAERIIGKRFGGVVLIRQTLDDISFLVPDFSAGFEYRIISEEEHYLKLNISRNSKIPSLNDLFWNPGGNPDLKNEHAYSYEIGYKSGQKILPGLTLNSEVNFFNNYIRDMIQWHPVNDTLWMADNIGNVNSNGIELSVYAKYMLNDLSVDLNALYSYTRAFKRNNGDSDASGKQIIFIPKNTANSSVRVTYRNIYATWGTTFTGKTFTTADNTKFLKSYTLNNLTGGTTLSLSKNIIDLNFRIENIFDVVYQSIEYYPRPGRSYFLTLSFRFKK